METFLQQLERQIAKMSLEDRAIIVDAVTRALSVCLKYGRPAISAGAVLKFVGALTLANAGDSMPKFKQRLKARAHQVGPNVGALFQAI